MVDQYFLRSLGRAVHRLTPSLVVLLSFSPSLVTTEARPIGSVNRMTLRRFQQIMLICICVGRRPLLFSSRTITDDINLRYLNLQRQILCPLDSECRRREHGYLLAISISQVQRGSSESSTGSLAEPQVMKYSLVLTSIEEGKHLQGSS